VSRTCLRRLAIILAIPRGVNLDFSLDVDRNPKSMERELKSALMKTGKGNVVGVVRASVVGSIGLHGVGKPLRSFISDTMETSSEELQTGHILQH
jgi:hypothetical protein